jgi:hypothetical protein
MAGFRFYLRPIPISGGNGGFRVAAGPLDNRFLSLLSKSWLGPPDGRESPLFLAMMLIIIMILFIIGRGPDTSTVPALA